MKVSHKLLLVQAAIFLIGMTAIFHAYHNTRAIGVEYTRVVDESLPMLQALNELRSAAIRVASSTSEYGLITSLADTRTTRSKGQDVNPNEHEDSLTEEEAKIEVGGDALLRGFDMYDQLMHRELSVIWTQGGMRDKGWNLIVAGAALRDGLERQAPAAELLQLRAHLEDAKRDILSAIAARIGLHNQELQLRKDQVHETISFGLTALVVLGALTLLGAFLANFFSLQAIAKPLAQLTEATIRLAKGDFTPLPENKSSDEIGTLTIAFRHMAKELQALIRRNEAAIDAAHASNMRFRDIAEASSDWIWETDTEHQITYLSDRFIDVTGHDVEPLIGQSQLEFLTPARPDDKPAELNSALAANQSFRDLCCRFIDAKGRPRICRLAGKPIVTQDGNFLGYRGTATDITVEVEAQAQAQHLALHDALTGLPNRVLLAERFEHSLSSMRRQGGVVAVLCLDLDHFKDINDTLGHGAGDLLLKQVADRLLGSVRGADTVGRLGGDEFVIVQADIDQPSDTELLCRRLIESLAETYDLDGHEVQIKSSIGVAIAPQNGVDHGQLLKNADMALYRAKAEGRGVYRFFEEEMNLKLQQRKMLEADLRQALAKDQFELHYQPQFGLDGKQVTGVEALIRWHHPKHGMVAPLEFIPTAEETGLIIPITQWVLHRACSEALSWEDLSVAINLSPAAFKHQDLLGLIEGVLHETKFDPRRLELEITETILLQDTEHALMILNDLKAMGIRIAMDDFGTGYSSLSHLQRFPFDKIKIDRSFVSELTANKDSKAIVRAVINLGQSLGMATTAEGVETDDQAVFLTSQGCDEVQGFYYARPMPAFEIASIVEAKNAHTLFADCKGTNDREAS
ncbi:MAG: EAL domain-containing protein [Geminicoccales bacterium]